MCYHLISFSGSCVTSFMKIWGQWKHGLLRTPSNPSNTHTETNLSHWYVVIHCLYKVHGQWVSFSHWASPAHIRPFYGLYPSSMHHANSPEATQMLLIFPVASLCLFFFFLSVLPEQESSLFLGRKRPDSRQKQLVVEKQWHALCDSYCPPEPQTSSSLQYSVPSICQITAASSYWLCQRWPRSTDQDGRASCQKDGEERKREWEKCCNCRKKKESRQFRNTSLRNARLIRRRRKVREWSNRLKFDEIPLATCVANSLVWTRPCLDNVEACACDCHCHSGGGSDADARESQA